MAARIFGDTPATAPLLERQRPAPVGSSSALRRLGRDGEQAGERHVCKNADHKIGERASPHVYGYRCVTEGL